MIITKEHLVGFAAGVGVSAAAYYVYKKNQVKVDDFIEKHKIAVDSHADRPYEELSLEELMFEKEKIEDLIAEKEMVVKEQVVKPKENDEKVDSPNETSQEV